MGPSQICGCPFREPRVFTIAHMKIIAAPKNERIVKPYKRSGKFFSISFLGEKESFHHSLYLHCFSHDHVKR